MKPLHDEARRVILEGRSADASPRGSAARNWQALVSRLDAPLPPRAAAAERSLLSPLAGSGWSNVLLKFVLWGAVLGGIGGGLALFGRDASTRTVVAPLAKQAPGLAAPTPRAASDLQLTAAPQSDAPERAAAARPAARAHRLPPTAASLAAETRLIAEAQSKLSEGAPARALALLDQHREEFPRGDLVPEREAARVLALCALGRSAEAKTVRARFEHDFSSSPLLARVRAGCAAH